MHSSKLLSVSDTFQIEGRGLIVTPDFSIPTGGWKHHAEEVTVTPPSGDSFCALAHFESTHFNIPDPDVSMDKRWRVVVLFPDKTKADIPIGSSLWTSPEFHATLNKKAEQDAP